MISSNRVLTIGPEFVPPKGGVAQCIATYQQAIFSDFRCLTNSCDGSFLKKTCKALFSLAKLHCILATNSEIKIVHIHTASYNSFKRSAWFVKAAKRMGRKVVIHIHGGGFREYYDKEKSFIQPIIDQCDALITLSPQWKMFFEKVVHHKNVHIVPNVIAYPVVKTVAKTDMFHLLYMGHITKAKGIFDLVEMLAEHKDEYLGRLILDIGGGMYEEEKLKRFISDNKMEDILRFHGWLSGEGKTDIFNLADAYILPSYTEGVPISILEAESYGLPVLSTTVGGIPEIVADRENGLLFEPGNKQRMKIAIDALMQDKELRISMAERSKEISMKNLPQFVEQSLLEVYKSI